MSRSSKDFYSSQAWKDARRAYRQSVGNLCERCMARGEVTPAEIVHHKEPLTPENITDLNITLGWGNLQALCRQCHAEVHDDIYAKRSGRRYKIDKSGRVTIKDDSVL